VRHAGRHELRLPIERQQEPVGAPAEVGRAMRVLIAGGSGLVGRSLARTLRAAGFEVRRLVRRAPSAPDEIAWDPARGHLDPGALAGVEGVVNLSGRSLFAPWTRRVKAEIMDSRVRPTRLLVETVAAVEPRPRVLVSASAVGYYGSRGDEVLTEASSPGTGFLAEVAQAWEAEARRAAQSGIRVVCARFGLVLARGGGALGAMAPLFRLGLGGPLGRGQHWWSWIHIDDLVSAITTALSSPSLEGPVNLVAPTPVTNREFARTLAGALHRPALVPAPAFAVRLVLGEMAEEMILASQRVMPARLLAAGFAFRWQELAAALENLTARR
jgi:uncharacterized protein (TIGR01777 family)